jgi:hypothetical protein
MKIQTKSIVMAVAMATAAASALSSQAADQSAFFEQQQQITDGYYPQVTIVHPAPPKQLTPHEAAESEWLTAQIRVGNGSGPVPFPVPKVTPAAAPRSTETLHQIQEDQWFAQEIKRTDGDDEPNPFPSSAAASAPVSAAAPAAVSMASSGK